MLGQLLAEIPGAAVQTASGASYGNLSLAPGDTLAWDPDAAAPPNAAWLALVQDARELRFIPAHVSTDEQMA